VSRAISRRLWPLLGGAVLLLGLDGSAAEPAVAPRAPVAAETSTSAARSQTVDAVSTLSGRNGGTLDPARGSARSAMAQLPLYFVENRGQSHPRVRYHVSGSGLSVYLASDGLTFALSPRAGNHRAGSPESPSRGRWSVKLDFLGARRDVTPRGEEHASAIVSYFTGDRASWTTGVPTYSRVVYPDLWPGIDLVYSGANSRLKYTFVVRPGGDPRQIVLGYRGVSDVRVTEAGRLAVTTPVGGFEDEKPYAYQEDGVDRAEVAAAYSLLGSGERGARRYGFHVGDYDKTKTLILDPVILAYCGFLGGSSNDDAFGITVDGSGNAYVVGWTDSNKATFPETVGAFDTNPNGMTEAFVAKLNSSGSLVYCSFLGGSNIDKGYGIAVDGSGNAYITGETNSTEGAGNFPVTVGAFDTTQNGGVDAWVAKVNAAGSALLYCTFLGGTGFEWGRAIAVDSATNAYVTGRTNSSQASFPVMGTLDGTYNGGEDAYVAKLDAAGSGLVYRGYIGGAADDAAFAIAVDSSFNAYVAGETKSSQPGFPVTGGAFDTTYNGTTDTDAFVAKVNAAGSALAYCTYIGGSSPESGAGIAVDGSGNAYVTGQTDSSQATFPVTVGPDLTINGGTDVWVAKVNAAGSALVYSGYIGGSLGDWGFAIARDSADNVYITGYTESSDLPLNPLGGPDLTFNGVADAFVVKVNAAGTYVYYCGYIGGSGSEWGRGIAVDSSGNVYVIGPTTSTQTNFPVAGSIDASQNGAQDAFVAKLQATATVVRLSSFTARGMGEAVELSWTTASELDNLGFHLYRAAQESGPYERITPTLIPGLGSSPAGATYTYHDRGLTNDATYYYKLEDLDASGAATQHGPVSATPQPEQSGSGGGGAGAPEADGSGEEPAPSRIAYGDPSANGLRVVRERSGEVLLELVTEGFHAYPQADGSVRIESPGLVDASAPGSPAIPVKRTWVDAVAGRGARVTSVHALDVRSFTGLRPTATEAPRMVVSPDGVVRAAGSRAREGAEFRRPGLHPGEPARIEETGFQGEVKRALVELAPLRWDPSSGRLLLARRLRVRVSFAGVDAAERGLGGARGRRHRERRAHWARAVLARLLAPEQGLHRIAFEEVFRARARAIPVSSLKLGRQGEAVAFHIEPPTGAFGPGSALYFVSEGGASNPYANEAVYELEQARGGRVMAVGSAAPWGSSTGAYWRRGEWEQNRYYQSGLLEAPSLWLWDIVASPARKSYSFTLSSVVSAPARVQVWLQGASDFEASPDHHVRVSVNGTPVGEASWDGKTAKVIEGEVSGEYLHEGENRLEIHNVGDTAAAHSMVFLDRFAVTYARQQHADAGVFEGSFSASGIAEVKGLGAGSLVVQTMPEPRWLRGASASPAGLAFRAESESSYLVVSPAAVRKPIVKTALVTGLRGPRNRADYLLIAPRQFLAAAEPLLEQRRSQGLVSAAVAVEDVYDDFGYGESRAEAIKEFLAYAYHHWRTPSVRYVLLLGDATYDGKDYLRTGVSNRVPALTVRSTYLWTASDPSFGALNGDDRLPDIAVGRLPAASVEQARVMIGKVLDYERSGLDLSAPAVLVADNPDQAGDFEADSEEIAERLVGGREVERIYLGQLGPALTRSAIAAAFDRGASLVSYVGHGGIAVWASENVLNNQGVASLAPQARQPIVLTMNCLNGYFHFPPMNSLSEELVKAEGRGAVAAFSPSGLSLDQPAHVYEGALVNELFSGRHARLGDALLAAQRAYADSGAFPELLDLYHLFGDPALTLK
jgi:hypothetical protein